MLRARNLQAHACKSQGISSARAVTMRVSRRSAHQPHGPPPIIDSHGSSRSQAVGYPCRMFAIHARAPRRSRRRADGALGFRPSQRSPCESRGEVLISPAGPRRSLTRMDPSARKPRGIPVERANAHACAGVALLSEWRGAQLALHVRSRMRSVRMLACSHVVRARAARSSARSMCAHVYGAAARSSAARYWMCDDNRMEKV